MRQRRYRNPETGDTISADGVIHGVRYGLDVESTDEDHVILIDGERYELVDEDDGGDDDPSGDSLEEKLIENSMDTMKEWVEDPSPDASTMRWRNTEMGEYRYQLSKPDSQSADNGGDDEGGVLGSEDCTRPIGDVDDWEEGDEEGVVLIRGERYVVVEDE